MFNTCSNCLHFHPPGPLFCCCFKSAGYENRRVFNQKSTGSEVGLMIGLHCISNIMLLVLGNAVDITLGCAFVCHCCLGFDGGKRNECQQVFNRNANRFSQIFCLCANREKLYWVQARPSVSFASHWFLCKVYRTWNIINMKRNKKSIIEYGMKLEENKWMCKKSIRTIFVLWEIWACTFFTSNFISVCCSFVADLRKPPESIPVEWKCFFDLIVPMMEIELSHTCM